jgi:hypothetical protein
MLGNFICDTLLYRRLENGANQRAMKTTFSSNVLAYIAIGIGSLLIGGCGGATPPAEGAHEHHEHGHHEHGEHGKHEHPEMTGAIREMHDVLAPLWHAEKNAERETKTCAAIPTFKERAGAIEATVPESAKAKEAAYREAAQGLVKAVGGLETECAKASGGRAEFEAKFHEVHEAFHKVMEQSH